MKRIFDLIFSIIGLIILIPIFIIVAILIKINMPDGPIFFTQKRVGQHGKLFTIYKFRTMHSGHLGSSISVKGENRITHIGAKLRKYKIDELPELWNVLIGNMSFVGPRPDVTGYADKLIGDDRNILKLKPGITCEASLKYANEEALLSIQENPIKYNDEVIFPDKVKMNLDYYKNNNIIKDIKIIFKTIIR